MLGLPSITMVAASKGMWSEILNPKNMNNYTSGSKMVFSVAMKILRVQKSTCLTQISIGKRDIKPKEELFHSENIYLHGFVCVFEDAMVPARSQKVPAMASCWHSNEVSSGNEWWSVESWFDQTKTIQQNVTWKEKKIPMCVNSKQRIWSVFYLAAINSYICCLVRKELQRWLDDL